jgi:hypothetical protein
VGNGSATVPNFFGLARYRPKTEVKRMKAENGSRTKVREVKRQIANYRKFLELTQEWVTLAIESCKIKNEQQRKE